ncbi:unnamed protein product, partial [Meganyctiphanes norvegica]
SVPTLTNNNNNHMAALLDIFLLLILIIILVHVRAEDVFGSDNVGNDNKEGGVWDKINKFCSKHCKQTRRKQEMNLLIDKHRNRRQIYLNDSMVDLELGTKLYETFYLKDGLSGANKGIRQASGWEVFISIAAAAQDLYNMHTNSKKQNQNKMEERA